MIGGIRVLSDSGGSGSHGTRGSGGRGDTVRQVSSAGAVVPPYDRSGEFDREGSSWKGPSGGGQGSMGPYPTVAVAVAVVEVAQSSTFSAASEVSHDDKSGKVHREGPMWRGTGRVRGNVTLTDRGVGGGSNGSGGSGSRGRVGRGGRYVGGGNGG